jgi:hypothetical protein
MFRSVLLHFSLLHPVSLAYPSAFEFDHLLLQLDAPQLPTSSTLPLIAISLFLTTYYSSNLALPSVCQIVSGALFWLVC